MPAQTKRTKNWNSISNKQRRKIQNDDSPTKKSHETGCHAISLAKKLYVSNSHTNTVFKTPKNNLISMTFN